jgi:phosphate:Na+ symporter
MSERNPELFLKLNKNALTLNKKADTIKEHHLDRMREGVCQPLPAITFSDMTVAMRRVKNHTVNLFEALHNSPKEFKNLGQQTA